MALIGFGKLMTTGSAPIVIGAGVSVVVPPNRSIFISVRISMLLCI